MTAPLEVRCQHCGKTGYRGDVIRDGWFEVTRGMTLRRWFCSWRCLTAHCYALMLERAYGESG